MNIEQKAHDLTMLFLNKSIDSSNYSNSSNLEIAIIEKYLKYYSIVYEQLQNSLKD